MPIAPRPDPDRLIVLTGCSGGGKSTLLAELAARGVATVPEPGRRIVQRGQALPWTDPHAFAHACAELALADLEAAEASPAPLVVFDRSALDALAWFERTGHAPPPSLAALAHTRRYARTIFMAPPRPELWTDADPERRHTLADALTEYAHLKTALPRWGYELRELPKLPVRERAAWLLGELGQRDEHHARHDCECSDGTTPRACQKAPR